MQNTSYLLMKASRALKQRLDHQLNKHDITASQFSVLYQIRRNNNRVVASEVAKALDLDRPTISAIIKRLESKGIVTRIPHEKDKRSEYLMINEQFVAVVDELREESDALDKEMFNEHTSSELQAFHSVLLSIIKK